MEDQDYSFQPIEFDPFAGPEIQRAVPSIEPQAEIWAAYLIGGEDANRSYNESVSLELNGILDYSALIKSIRSVIQRHEALRSGFSADGQQMLIYSEGTLEYTEEDLSQKSPQQQEEIIKDFLIRDAKTSFNLLTGPLFRINLFTLDKQKHHLTLTAHHIICDGWSMAIVMQDLGKLYTAFVQGTTPELNPAPSFAEYAIRQKEFQTSGEYKAIEKYWIDQYQGEIPVLDIPTDFSRPTDRTYKSQRDDYALDPNLAASLRALGAAAGCTFVTTMLAAFEAFLFKISGQNDIVLGVPVAGQATEGNYNLVGHCVSLVPLRSYPQGEETFGDFLKKRKSGILDAFENQPLTFGSLLKKLSIQRDASRIPLVPVIFNIDLNMEEGVDFKDLTYDLNINKREYENFELFVNISGSDHSQVLEWSYNTQLFRPETIKKMMDNFLSLLQEITRNPEVRLTDIQFSDTEEQIELAGSQTVYSEYPENTPVHEIIEQIAAQHPEKIALDFHGERISYKKLNEEANRLAALLISEGVQEDDKVALSLDRSAEMIITLLAILKSGAAYIPIDPSYPKKRIEYMLKDSDAKLLLTSKKFKGKFSSEIREIVQGEYDLNSFSELNPELKVNTQRLAYIIYTSGTSGKPKGTMIEHRSLVNLLWSLKKSPGLSADDRLLAVTTISFDMSVVEIFLPLVCGAELHIADADATKDGRTLLRLLKSEKITVMQATPSTWRMMLDAGWDSSVNIKIFCGGEPLPKEMASKLISLGNELWNMYGPTETTVYATIKHIKSENEPITIGKPINNTKAYILDRNQLLVPNGSEGELCIAGDCLAKGYLNQPELTESTFINNPFSKGKNNRIYRTGDLAKLDSEGDIVYLGRIDQQMKIRGFRIEPGEIEYSLNIQDDIRESVVILREDKPGHQRLTAYVIANEEPASTEHSGFSTISEQDKIENWKLELKELLPSHMIPADFMILPKMPLLPNGKIDKNALPKPNQLFAGSKKGIPPRTDIEKMIANIWAEALGLESVGVFDDFFELGGHSLIAIQVMTRIEKETKVRLSLSTLFNHSTVEELALLLELDSKSITWDSLVPIKPQGDKIPLYIVHGAGLNVLIFNTLAKNMDSNQPVYGLQAKGLNGIDEPLETIEEMASHYISEIVNHNPSGPYALAGFSFGGIIAFEMAKQLKAMGKEVKMLAMFDTYADQSDKNQTLPKRAYNYANYFIKQLIFSFVLLAEDPKRTIEYKAQSVGRRLIQLYWRLRYGKDQKQVGFFGYAHNIDTTNEQASDNYIITPYDGVIELFRAKKKTFYMEDFEYLGWKPYALKGVNIHEIPGEHNYIFAAPNDKEFARILQDCLDGTVNDRK